MSSKRSQEHSDNPEKRKRIKKREEVAQLSVVVDDEEVKKAVKEAWAQGVHYSHGEWPRVLILGSPDPRES